MGQELIFMASCRVTVSDFIRTLQQYRRLYMRNINVILFRWQHSKLDVGQNIIPVIIFIWSCIPLCYNRGCSALNTTAIL